MIGPGGGIYLPELFGNTNLKSEELLSYEAGYRVQPGKRVSLDLAAFYNDYSRLAATGPDAFIPVRPLAF